MTARLDTATRRTPHATAAGVPGRRPGQRSLRRASIGGLLVLATVAVFWQTELRANASRSYLAVIRPVPAGQVIADADVDVARVANMSGLDFVPAADRTRVVGRTAAVPLAAGSLLTTRQLGPSSWPPPGQAAIALPVKPGRTPAGLTAGARVVVLVTPASQQAPPSTASPAPGGGVTAQRGVGVVVSLAADASHSGGHLVTLLMPANTAEVIASTPGDVSIVQLGTQG